MIGCTHPDCEAEGVEYCDSCRKVRCADHIELDEPTGEWFCDFGTCGGSGLACRTCRVRRVNVDGMCWGCWRITRESTWPDGWSETVSHVTDCRCGQPACATDGYLHACSPTCAREAEAKLQSRIAKYGEATR